MFTFQRINKGRRRTKTDTEKISFIRKIPMLIFHEFYTENQRKIMNPYNGEQKMTL